MGLMAEAAFAGPIYPSTIIKKVLKSQPLKLSNNYMLKDDKKYNPNLIFSSTKEKIHSIDMNGILGSTTCDGVSYFG